MQALGPFPLNETSVELDAFPNPNGLEGLFSMDEVPDTIIPFYEPPSLQSVILNHNALSESGSRYPMHRDGIPSKVL